MKHKSIQWAVLSVSFSLSGLALAGGPPAHSGCSSDADCNDSNACTWDICHGNGTCSHASAWIDDSDACTVDTCSPSAGVAHTPVVCPVADAQCQVAATCHQVWTWTGGASGKYVPSCASPTNKPNGTACNDGNGCTINDSCQNGACVGTPSSGSILFETRPYSGAAPTSTPQAISTFNGLPAGAAGYGSASLSSLASWSNQSTLGGTNSNIAYHMKIDVVVGNNQVGKWGFRLGPDFGHGGTIVVDGAQIAARWTDMWWNGNFNNPSQSLTGYVSLTAGPHVVEIYGFEVCCDGPGTLQYTAPGGSSLWATVSKSSTAVCF
jgi:hypothetical protein